MEYTEFLKPSIQKRQKRRDKRLGEEVIECYRRGWRTKRAKGYRKMTERNFFQHALQHEGMKVLHKGGSKTFDDNLEPLIRYLNSSVGKNWDKVYSELCQKLDRRTVTGLHVFNHLFDFVKLNVFLENKKVYYLQFGKKTELKTYGNWSQLYVHPKTGQLMKPRIKK